MKKRPAILTAALIITGNELLSGDMKDDNLQILAKALQPVGIKLTHVRIVEDIPEVISEQIITLRESYSYIFVSGGIGPTHDDVTAAGVAMAFGVPLVLNKQAYNMLHQYYGSELNKVHLKMTYLPKSCKLIENPVNAVPGFIMENVYMMSGVPSIFQIMLGQVVHQLEGGQVMLTDSVSVTAPEAEIVDVLDNCLKKFPSVEIGSYPYVRYGYFGTEIIMRCLDEKKLASAMEYLQKKLEPFNNPSPKSA